MVEHVDAHGEVGEMLAVAALVGHYFSTRSMMVGLITSRAAEN
jgi:hypothetical protein